MRATRLLLIALLCLAVLPTCWGYYCPPGCTCIPRSVRCLRARLTAVPRVPQDTELLDLRFNNFKEIPANAFEGLTRLKTLYLNENGIGFIHENALDGLVGLRFLYLNNNRISRLPIGVFQQLKQLEAIFLENNDIWQISSTTFSNLEQLTRISLFNNKITNLPSGAFNNLPRLKRLRLDGNPIDCDCGVYSLWRYHQRHPQRSQITIQLTCETPSELYRKQFNGLQERNFHCRKPEVIDAPHDMHLTTGDTVVLPCQMTGDPSPEIIWMQNTNEISVDYLPKMEILSTGSLKINSVDMNDIGIYECIGRNEVGETKTQPIRMMVEAPWQPQQQQQQHQEKQRQQHQQQQRQQQTTHNYNNQRLQTIATQLLPLEQDEPPRFTRTPTDRTVAIDGPAVVLDCTATGTPQPEIQWFHNGRLATQSTQTIRIQSNGSLIITQPTLLTAGTYRCEATNHLGSIQTSARIDVKEFPEILMAPQNQTIKIGKPFILECDADGNPIPIITWRFNGSALATNARIVLENENTELIVSEARESDSGIYTCIATNENGMSEVEATIVVEQNRGAPKIIIEPFDLEAFVGTTIELPCKAEEEEALKITWRRDGRKIDPNQGLVEKYQISGTGSLFVKNVTIFDGGRYECSLKNEFGRATASALVTIRSNVDLAPGDRYVRIAFAEAAKEIDIAINNTIDMLFTNRSRTSGSPTPPNYSDLLRVFRFPTGEARQLARAAEIYERTLVNIRKHVLKGDNLTMTSDKYEFRDLLSREHLHLVAELSGCMEHREMPNCTDMCYHSKYRSIDGTCNNLHHPTWGASLTAFRRIASPIYENGFSMPIGWTKNKLYAGFPKPSSRLVSTSMISTKEITPDDSITHMVMQWGQFLDHDLDHAIPSVSSESWDGIDCKKTCELAPPCYPIEVPPNDPRVKNRRCIDVVRSSSICGSGMTSVFFESIQHREQINQLTSFIDASQVYGYSYEFAQELRNLTTDDGLLRVGVHFPNQKDMLPFAAPQDGMDCRRNLDENTMNCFVSGDIRVNEQVGLLAMHTVWMREHNRIAIKLRDINPHWDGDTIYQETRKIVGAEMQHITFKHWLPLIVGDGGMQMLGEYRGYNPNENPTIANEFATAALRFGHTIINPMLHRLNSSFQPIPQGHLQLHKAFFAPWRIAYEGGIDPLMRGMFAVAAKLKTPDQNLNTELTEKLFYSSHAVALDLAAINIQRGRDHGIPGYNVYRKFCNLTVAQNFEDLRSEISDAETRRKLKKLYGHPDNIDVWVGGILEDQVAGGKVGPLFQCLLVDQFRRLRDGDRFYYENPSVFLPEQLQQIKQANLGRVLCDNGDKIEEVTDNVFVLPKKQGGFKKCEDVAGVNLYFWQDCGACNSLPPLFDSYVPQTYVKKSESGRHKRSTDEQSDATEPAQHMESVDNTLEALFEANEERVSGLEEVISSFQKELKKVHKKLHKLEESCSSNGKSEDGAQRNEGLPTKQKRSHCVDVAGNTRLLNEVWSPDACTKCECRHGQVTCTHEKCAEVKCAENEEILTPPEACCAHCVYVGEKDRLAKKSD